MWLHIIHDGTTNTVTMRLAKPEFLEGYEVTFGVTSLQGGSSAITVSQKMKPAVPPVSKGIFRV